MASAPLDAADAQLASLFAVLRRNGRLLVRIVVGGGLAIAVLVLALPTRYTAKAQIVVEEPRTPRADERIAATVMGPDQATMQTQVTALTAHDLLANVIAELVIDPAFRAIEGRDRRSILAIAESAHNTLAVEKLERHLHVFQEAGSHVISIAYTSNDAAEAAAIANKITAYYLAAGEDQSRSANQAVATLSKKLADLRSESKSLEAAVAAYQSAHGVTDAYKTNLIDEKLNDLNHQLALAQSEQAARKARHAQLLASRGPKGNWAPLLAGLDAQSLVELHDQVSGVLEGRQASLAFVPHASAESLQGQTAPSPLRDKVQKELDQALLQLSGDERVAGAQVAAIEQRLGAVQRASDDVKLRELVAASASARHRYERLLQRRNELLEQGDDVTAPARLLSWAAVPRRPSSLNPLLFVPPALIALLLIGCAAALMRERLHRRIYTDSDVASELGVRCAGFVPVSEGLTPAEGKPLESAAPNASFLEGVRGIMVSLKLVALGGRRPQVILVTSSVPGEGKTTLARSLAVCAARTGSKVLLLDLETRNEPGLSHAAHRASRKHITQPVDMLARDGTLFKLTPIGAGTGLDYLPVRRGLSTELSALFSVERMSEMLNTQRSSYDLIFIDGAAVLAKAEVRLMAAIADQIVFVVRWGKTRRKHARAALALLRGCGPSGTETAATISAAITQVDLERQADTHLAWASG